MKCPYCNVELEKGLCEQCGFDVDNAKLIQEIASLRAVLERILRVMDEGLFVDYQMEKFGHLKYNKELNNIGE